MARGRAFINANNDQIWANYEEIKRNDGASSASINQYRSAIYTLESVVMGIDLENISAEDVAQARKTTPTKKNHINGFIIDTFNEGLCNYKPSVIFECMGQREQKAIQRLLNSQEGF